MKIYRKYWMSMLLILLTIQEYPDDDVIPGDDEFDDVISGIPRWCHFWDILMKCY